MSLKKNVQTRYAAGAKKKEAILCCPVNYNPEYLKIIPEEVIARDYGCGDPSAFIKSGETVLDLGSGGGKICFIASQIVGPKGKVIGVDMTPQMLKLARDSEPKVAEKTGFSNIKFYRGHIENLKLNLDKLDEFLQKNPTQSTDDFEKMNEAITQLQEEETMIPDNSIDVIVSNCVLNLVSDVNKDQLFQEMFRVLKKGGRIVISDIVSDEVSPKSLKKDAKLWSGCISGALTESEFLEKCEKVGFYGTQIEKLEMEPWQIVEGIEYRSMTIIAYKGKEGVCLEKNQALLYKGPWKKVVDDDGHIFLRGKRMAVCEKTFEIMKKEPYSKEFIAFDPAKKIKNEIIFDGGRDKIRHPSETKSGKAKITTNREQSSAGSCC